jgi:hypothetical protein
MRFDGAFTCECGETFTINIGPQQMAEWKTPKKRAEQIGQLSLMLGRSCDDCEKGHREARQA